MKLKMPQKTTEERLFCDRKKANASLTSVIIVALVFQLVRETTEEDPSLDGFLLSFPPTTFFLPGDSD